METVRVDEWEKGGRDSERREKRVRADTRERVGGELDRVSERRETVKGE